MASPFRNNSFILVFLLPMNQPCGFCGIWGTLSLGLFACGKFGATGPLGPDNSVPLKRLFYGGGFQLLMAQIIGSVIITITTFAVAMGLMYAVNAIGLLRVSEVGELEGLDIHEHGIPAYPEYVTHPAATPQGATTFLAEESTKVGNLPPYLDR